MKDICCQKCPKQTENNDHLSQKHEESPAKSIEDERTEESNYHLKNTQT